MPRSSIVLLAALTACESGLSVDYTLTIAQSAVAATAPDAPGLLRVHGAPDPVVRVLCGGSGQLSARYTIDLGFGCLDDLRGSTEERRAWIEPMPEGWDAQALCALDPPRFRWDGVTIDASVTGPGVDPREVLAEAPDAAWTQGRGAGTWRRDGSPCGGVLPVEIRLP